MSLPYDVARCSGVQIDGVWRDGCEACLRRTSQGHEYWQAFIAPPAIIVFECEHRIEGEKE